MKLTKTQIGTLLHGLRCENRWPGRAWHISHRATARSLCERGLVRLPHPRAGLLTEEGKALATTLQES